jgi:hypothetical protein
MLFFFINVSLLICSFGTIHFLHPIVVLLYIKEQRLRYAQKNYIINNVELNSGHHVSVTQDHLQALIDTLLTLKKSYM